MSDLIFNLPSGQFIAKGVIDITTPYTSAPPPNLPPQNGQNITPLMTGPTTGGWTFSATSEYTESGVTASAWKAANGSAPSALWQNGWSSAVAPSVSSPQTLSIRNTQQFAIYSVGLRVRTDLALLPVACKIQDTAGNVLLSLSSISWPTNSQTFVLTTPALVTGLDIVFTASSGSLVQVDEISLFS